MDPHCPNCNAPNVSYSRACAYCGATIDEFPDLAADQLQSLKSLGDLHQSNVLTDEEFLAAKRRIFGEPPQDAIAVPDLATRLHQICAQYLVAAEGSRSTNNILILSDPSNDGRYVQFDAEEDAVTAEVASGEWRERDGADFVPEDGRQHLTRLGFSKGKHPANYELRIPRDPAAVAQMIVAGFSAYGDLPRRIEVAEAPNPELRSSFQQAFDRL